MGAIYAKNQNKYHDMHKVINIIIYIAGFLEVPWSIEVPMINFSPEIKNFQLWGYSSTSHEKLKIGREFVIDHSKIDIESNYVQ